MLELMRENVEIKNSIGCKLNEINFYVRMKCALKDCLL